MAKSSARRLSRSRPFLGSVCKSNCWSADCNWSHTALTEVIACVKSSRAAGLGFPMLARPLNSIPEGRYSWALRSVRIKRSLTRRRQEVGASDRSTFSASSATARNSSRQSRTSTVLCVGFSAARSCAKTSPQASMACASAWAGESGHAPSPSAPPMATPPSLIAGVQLASCSVLMLELLPMSVKLSPLRIDRGDCVLTGELTVHSFESRSVVAFETVLLPSHFVTANIVGTSMTGETLLRSSRKSGVPARPTTLLLRDRSKLFTVTGDVRTETLRKEVGPGDAGIGVDGNAVKAETLRAIVD
mmetsp:Transcript_15844/g.43361  ORF Transcript_15844/g.43361 Transcript_15844/m.43361 type:complete len:303 (-) Transcript_15844:253-1161(-)